MKRALCIILSILMSISIVNCAFAETTDNPTLVEQVGELIAAATPEERQEIMAGLILYMLFVDGEDSVNTAFEGLGDAFTVDSTNEAPAETADATQTEAPATVDFPIIFEGNGFEVYLTAWETCEFYGGDLGYDFSLTVYNNSDTAYEFGVKNLKINGWNIHEDGTYSSILRLDSGEKTRETWQVSGVVEKAGLASLDEVEEITGLFFLGDIAGWGDEIVTLEITITKADIDQLLCKD